MRHTISEADRLVNSIVASFDGDVDQLLELIRSTMRTMDSEIDSLRASFLVEIRNLAETVSAARAEIANLRGEELGNPIPEATDELDAIVEHTAAATETILDACEQLDQLAVTFPDQQGASVQEHTMRIYEACSFQDLTGQRISKVVAALKVIEQRIETLTGRYDLVQAPLGRDADPLLNGPQAPDIAISQDEIDKLLTF